MFDRIRQVREVLRKPADLRSLSEKVLISGALSSVEYALNIFFRIGSTLIVTRLLSPEIFGLFAIIMVFQTIVVMLTDFGIRSLIIVSDETKDPDFLRTCWSVQAFRGVCLFAFVLTLSLGLHGLQRAGLVSEEIVYGAAVLPAALAASGLQLVMQGLESVNQHVYAKEMRFFRITVVNIVRSATAPLLTVSIALFFPTVWSLVISGLLTGLMNLFLSFHLFDGPSMRFAWNRIYAAELFDRGKWIMSQSALTMATRQADQLLLSASIPPSLLGVYFLAKNIYSIPEALINNLHASFGLQFFREIIDAPQKSIMRDRYYKYRIPFEVLICLATGGLLTAAPAVIDLMYDPRYLDAGKILQILAIGLPIVGIGLIRTGYAAQKRFQIMALFGFVQAFSIWVGLLVALIIFKSPTGAFFVIALHRLPEISILLIMARSEGWIELRKEFRFWPLIGVGALLGLGVDHLWASIAG